MVSGRVWRVQGGSGGSRGGLIYPCRALFAPLEVFYGTRFGSKHCIVVQLTNVYWVGITGPFLACWGPSGSSQRAYGRRLKSFWDPEKFQNSLY